MNRLILAAGLAGLAVFPSGAVAATSHAKVLSVDGPHHAVQLVDAAHAVHAYRYRGKLPRLGLGDRVSYRRSGHTISHVKKTGRAFGTISFYATVVHSGAKRAQLRLGDGRAFSLSSTQVSTKPVAHAAASAASAGSVGSVGSVTVQVQGLAPGQTVLISETVDARGHWTIAITLPAASATSGGDTTTTGGSDDGAGHDPGDDRLAEGTITQVSESRLAVSTDTGALSFSVNPADDLTEGFLVGDVVDVTYYVNADQTLSADDLEYVEDDATGVVSTVSDVGLSLVDDATGQTDAFGADPALGLFDGVAPGDEVDVTYHQSAGGLVADAVGDDAWDN